MRLPRQNWVERHRCWVILGHNLLWFGAAGYLAWRSYQENTNSDNADVAEQDKHDQIIYAVFSAVCGLGGAIGNVILCKESLFRPCAKIFDRSPCCRGDNNDNYLPMNA